MILKLCYIGLFATGDLCILKYPYPRDIDEIHDYQPVTKHYLSRKENADSKSSNPGFSVSYRELWLLIHLHKFLF